MDSTSATASSSTSSNSSTPLARISSSICSLPASSSFSLSRSRPASSKSCCSTAFFFWVTTWESWFSKSL